jgi:hypothetical protein
MLTAKVNTQANMAKFLCKFKDFNFPKTKNNPKEITGANSIE